VSNDGSIRVLLIEDDDDVRSSTEQALSLAGFKVEAFANAERARSSIAYGVPAIVVCDVRLPGLSGTDWLPEIREVDAEIPVVLITGHGHIAMAVKAMREGAYDFVEKPFTSARLVGIVRHAVERRQLALQLRSLRDALENWNGIQAVLIGRSAQMQKVRRTAMTLAETSADVLIYGETGTGKELVARCLHDHSERRRQHFVPLNCGGLPEALAESELFGHEAGAFTSANRVRIGKFEHANGGTLFLDEIESMPMAVQVKLLRALQERSIERIGSNKPIAFDCRVVAASKDDLKLLSDQQKFRADLYYRIGVAIIELPPLRERREDIPLLFEHFTLMAAGRYRCSAPLLTHAQLADLMGYAWPGNVRELENAMERAVALERTTTVTVDSLPDAVRGTAAAASRIPSAVAGAQLPDTGFDLEQHVQHIEREYIAEALRRSGGVKVKAAELLGMSFRSFRYYMKKYNLG